MAGIAVLVILLVHLSAVKLSPESTYAQKTSISRLYGSDDSALTNHTYDHRPGQHVNADMKNSTNSHRAKAAFVILARNSDLWPIMESIRFMEDRFNKKYKWALRSRPILRRKG